MPTSSTSDFLAPEQPETPDVAGAYPRLTDEQLMLLSRFGERKALPKGAALFCEGDRDCDFFVLLDGAQRRLCRRQTVIPGSSGCTVRAAFSATCRC